VFGGDEVKTHGGFTPDPLHILLHRLDAQVMELVDAPSAPRPLHDQARLLEQAQVPRDGGTADRQDICDLLDRALPAAQELHDGAAIGIAERIERVTGGLRKRHDQDAGSARALSLPASNDFIRSPASGCSWRRG
jgi:hypothetical protein